MRLHRFIGDFSFEEGSASGGNFSKNKLTISDKELVNQIKNVLRLKIGDEIRLDDGKEKSALAEIISITRAGIEVDISEVSENKNELPIYGTLYCSILKRENFELVAQKATEIGIKEIVPIISSRTIKLNLREDRLEKIIKEAAEQSGRGIVPKLNKPMKFDDALMHSRANDLNFFFHPGGEPLKGIKHDFQRVGIFVGPEGGWDEVEEKVVGDLSTGAGHYKIANLGPLTLRAETAAIVATYAVLNK